MTAPTSSPVPASVPASLAARASSPPVNAVSTDQRAAAFQTRSIKTAAKDAGLRLALSMVDLTTLEGADSPGKVRALCRKAIRPMPDDEAILGERLPSVAAVCVYPSMVPIARDALGQSQIKLASVATGFPSGQYPLSVRLRDTAQAIADGADEIDMVINRGAFHAGRYDEVQHEIREVVAVCDDVPAGREPAHLKVILETGELGSYDQIRRASDLAISAIRDTDFIKTSTGKVSPAATMPVTLVMLQAIRDEALAGDAKTIGMKPAGGIRTAKQALHYLVMLKETLGDRWLTPDLFRFGASSLANDILRQIRRRATGVYADWNDFTDS